MLILDTNVVSELMKSRPDKRVIAWLDAQVASSVWTTSINVFEISFGYYLLPRGKRKKLCETLLRRFWPKTWTITFWTSTGRRQFVQPRFRPNCENWDAKWKCAMCRSPGSFRFDTQRWQLAMPSIFRIPISR